MYNSSDSTAKPAWSHDKIMALMVETGRMAMEFYQKAKIEIKSDRSLVTEADIAIEEYLAGELVNESEGCFLIGEESVAKKDAEYIDGAMRENTYVVDPIDGTANYANGLPFWGISLGLMTNSQLSHGAVFLPFIGELFITKEEEVWLYQMESGKVGDGEPLQFQTGLGAESGMIAITQNVAKRGKVFTHNPVHALANAVYPLTHILLGHYYAYLGKLKLWDLAGAFPMLQKAGLQCSLLDGTPVASQVDEITYHLDSGNPKRWSLKDIFLVTQKGDASKLMKAIHK